MIHKSIIVLILIMALGCAHAYRPDRWDAEEKAYYYNSEQSKVVFYIEYDLACYFRLIEDAWILEVCKTGSYDPSPNNKLDI